MEDIIKVKNLTKRYANDRGIFNFDFSVKKGEIFGLVGTNGSGKTTTLRHMIGFIKGDTGTVTVSGLDAWRDAAKIKRMVGYVPGQIDFPDVGTGTAFLKIQAEMTGISDLTYMNELIDRFKIDITAPLKRMSKGMKQKMALVAAFMAQPDIYLLDEPSTGLDPLMRDTLIGVILEQKAKGKTVFMSSHIFKELEDTCDTVMFIKDGHTVNTVRRSEFTENPHEQYAIRFRTEKDYRRFIETQNPKISNTDAEQLFVSRFDVKRKVIINIPASGLNELFAYLSTYDLESICSDSYSLEKYYVEIIEKQEVVK